MNRKILLSFIFILLALMIIGCKNDYPSSIYDSSSTGGAQPVITSITPTTTVAAVGDIIINGSNFSPVKEENFIYFDKIKVLPYFASATQLKVTPPNLEGDTVKIVIIVKGAEMFSDPPVKVKLNPAFIVYSDFGDQDDPVGLDMDKNGNLFVALNLIGVNCQVVKVTPDGKRSSFGTTGTSFANALKVGPDGSIYLTRNLSSRIYAVPAAGGTAVTYAILTSTGLDLDFDKNGNLWVAGEGKISRINPDKTFIDFPVEANLRAIRVYNDYLYYSGYTNDESKKEIIWRAKILTDGTLGPQEVYVDWSTKYWVSGKLVFAITFSNDGDMYIGTDGSDGIVVAKPDGTLKPLYPGYILPTGYKLTWGSGNSSNYLFVTRRNPLDRTKQRIMKIYMGKEGAPYYGRK